ncbi:MAG: MBOAT family O-acyltransferase [Muribaculaceae bacterium]
MEWITDIIDRIDPEMAQKLFLYDAQQPLLFNTGLFMMLFLGFVLIYQAIRRWRVAKMIVTILFSLYFYYKSSAGYCLILVGVCISDYLLGLWMGRAQRNWIRRLIVWINVLANIGMLVYFKYFNLLYETFANFTGVDFDALDIILPAGISFFTFRSISYIVDLYRRKMEPCTNFLDYMFFLTFFPPLLAGPVVRAQHLLPQIKANNPATRAMVAEGLFLIMCGIIKKMVIADYISGNFVDRIFENPSLYTGFENVMGMIGFTVQIYCDFSGYSDIAIGLALLLGYRFLDNFDSPFKSQNPSEFWRRWHISLSTWLRDYVYIPMGGNRRGAFRTHVNKFTTMMVGGIWHGASWMYLLWGAYQGLLLTGHLVIKRVIPSKIKLPGVYARRFFNILITFTLSVIGFAFFRSISLEHLAAQSTQIATNFHLEIAVEFAKAYAMILTLIGIGLVLHFTPSMWRKKVMGGYMAMPILIQAIILAIVLFIVIQTRNSELVPFVYLQY